MASREIDIVAMGFIFNEHIVWPDGKTDGPILGAPLSYSGVTFGKIGARVGLVSIVGTDTSPELLSPLFNCGADVTGVQFREGESETKNFLRYREDGTKQLDYLVRSPEIKYDDIPPKYHCAKMFHLCLSDYEVPLDTVKEIRKRLPDVCISADFGGLGGAASSSEQREKYVGTEAQKEYLQHIDIGKCSIEDAQLAFNQTFSDYREAAQAYIEMGVGLIVVTMGADGAFIMSKNGVGSLIPAVPAYNGVVDTTGAGDAYIAAFISEFFNTKDIHSASYFAGAVASVLIEKSGGVHLDRIPDRKQVEERLNNFWR